MKAHILICDDDLDILKVTESILAGKGYQVSVLPNCENIVEKTIELNPDLILMDLDLPGSGATATGNLKTNFQTKQIPVIIFSANMNVFELSRNSGADGFLSKPCTFSDIFNIVADTLKINNIYSEIA